MKNKTFKFDLGGGGRGYDFLFRQKIFSSVNGGVIFFQNIFGLGCLSTMLIKEF